MCQINLNSSSNVILTSIQPKHITYNDILYFKFFNHNRKIIYDKELKNNDELTNIGIENLELNFNLWDNRCYKHNYNYLDNDIFIVQTGHNINYYEKHYSVITNDYYYSCLSKIFNSGKTENIYISLSTGKLVIPRYIYSIKPDINSISNISAYTNKYILAVYPIITSLEGNMSYKTFESILKIRGYGFSKTNNEVYIDGYICKIKEFTNTFILCETQFLSIPINDLKETSIVKSNNKVLYYGSYGLIVHYFLLDNLDSISIKDLENIPEFPNIYNSRDWILEPSIIDNKNIKKSKGYYIYSNFKVLYSGKYKFFASVNGEIDVKIYDNSQNKEINLINKNCIDNYDDYLSNSYIENMSVYLIKGEYHHITIKSIFNYNQLSFFKIGFDIELDSLETDNFTNLDYYQLFKVELLSKNKKTLRSLYKFVVPNIYENELTYNDSSYTDYVYVIACEDSKYISQILKSRNSINVVYDKLVSFLKNTKIILRNYIVDKNNKLMPIINSNDNASNNQIYFNEKKYNHIFNFEDNISDDILNLISINENNLADNTTSYKQTSNVFYLLTDYDDSLNLFDIQTCRIINKEGNLTSKVEKIQNESNLIYGDITINIKQNDDFINNNLSNNINIDVNLDSEIDILNNFNKIKEFQNKVKILRSIDLNNKISYFFQFFEFNYEINLTAFSKYHEVFSKEYELLNSTEIELLNFYYENNYNINNYNIVTTNIVSLKNKKILFWPAPPEFFRMHHTSPQVTLYSKETETSKLIKAICKYDICDYNYITDNNNYIVEKDNYLKIYTFKNYPNPNIPDNNKYIVVKISLQGYTLTNFDTNYNLFNGSLEIYLNNVKDYFGEYYPFIVFYNSYGVFYNEETSMFYDSNLVLSASYYMYDKVGEIVKLSGIIFPKEEYLDYIRINDRKCFVNEYNKTFISCLYQNSKVNELYNNLSNIYLKFKKQYIYSVNENDNKNYLIISKDIKIINSLDSFNNYNFEVSKATSYIAPLIKSKINIVVSCKEFVVDLTLLNKIKSNLSGYLFRINAKKLINQFKIEIEDIILISNNLNNSLRIDIKIPPLLEGNYKLSLEILEDSSILDLNSIKKYKFDTSEFEIISGIFIKEVNPTIGSIEGNNEVTIKLIGFSNSLTDILNPFANNKYLNNNQISVNNELLVYINDISCNIDYDKTKINIYSQNNINNNAIKDNITEEINSIIICYTNKLDDDKLYDIPLDVWILYRGSIKSKIYHVINNENPSNFNKLNNVLFTYSLQYKTVVIKSLDNFSMLGNNLKNHIFVEEKYILKGNNLNLLKNEEIIDLNWGSIKVLENDEYELIFIVISIKEEFNNKLIYFELNTLKTGKSIQSQNSNINIVVRYNKTFSILNLNKDSISEYGGIVTFIVETENYNSLILSLNEIKSNTDINCLIPKDNNKILKSYGENLIKMYQDIENKINNIYYFQCILEGPLNRTNKVNENIDLYLPLTLNISLYNIIYKKDFEIIDVDQNNILEIYYKIYNTNNQKYVYTIYNNITYNTFDKVNKLNKIPVFYSSSKNTILYIKLKYIASDYSNLKLIINNNKSYNFKNKTEDNNLDYVLYEFVVEEGLNNGINYIKFHYDNFGFLGIKFVDEFNNYKYLVNFSINIPIILDIDVKESLIESSFFGGKNILINNGNLFDCNSFTKGKNMYMNNNNCNKIYICGKEAELIKDDLGYFLIKSPRIITKNLYEKTAIKNEHILFSKNTINSYYDYFIDENTESFNKFINNKNVKEKTFKHIGLRVKSEYINRDYRLIVKKIRIKISNDNNSFALYDCPIEVSDDGINWQLKLKISSLFVEDAFHDIEIPEKDDSLKYYSYIRILNIYNRSIVVKDIEFYGELVLNKILDKLICDVKIENNIQISTIDYLNVQYFQSMSVYLDNNNSNNKFITPSSINSLILKYLDYENKEINDLKSKEVNISISLYGFKCLSKTNTDLKLSEQNLLDYMPIICTYNDGAFKFFIKNEFILNRITNKQLNFSIEIKEYGIVYLNNINIKYTFSFTDLYENPKILGSDLINLSSYKEHEYAMYYSNGDIYIENKDVVLDITTISFNNIVINNGSLIIKNTLSLNQADCKLYAMNIIILNNGSFEIGNEDNRFKHNISIIIWGNKNYKFYNYSNVFHNILQVLPRSITGLDSSLKIHGIIKNSSFSHLAKSEYIGSQSIKVDDVVDWYNNDKIIVAGTNTIDRKLKFFNYDQAYIDSVNKNLKERFTEVYLTSKLKNDHIVEDIDFTSKTDLLNKIKHKLKVAVINITRNIIISSVIDDDFLEFDRGVTIQHINSNIDNINSVKNNNRIILEGVEINYGGNSNYLNGYTINISNNGINKNNIIYSCSFSNSINKGIVLSGSRRSTISNNVFFNIKGPSISDESGYERNNIIKDNASIYNRIQYGSINASYIFSSAQYIDNLYSANSEDSNCFVLNASKYVTGRYNILGNKILNQYSRFYDINGITCHNNQGNGFYISGIVDPHDTYNDSKQNFIYENFNQEKAISFNINNIMSYNNMNYGVKCSVKYISGVTFENIIVSNNNEGGIYISNIKPFKSLDNNLSNMTTLKNLYINEYKLGIRLPESTGLFIDNLVFTDANIINYPKYSLFKECEETCSTNYNGGITVYLRNINIDKPDINYINTNNITNIEKQLIDILFILIDKDLKALRYLVPNYKHINNRLNCLVKNNWRNYLICDGFNSGFIPGYLTLFSFDRNIKNSDIYILELNNRYNTVTNDKNINNKNILFSDYDLTFDSITKHTVKIKPNVFSKYKEELGFHNSLFKDDIENLLESQILINKSVNKEIFNQYKTSNLLITVWKILIINGNDYFIYFKDGYSYNDIWNMNFITNTNFNVPGKDGLIYNKYLPVFNTESKMITKILFPFHNKRSHHDIISYSLNNNNNVLSNNISTNEFTTINEKLKIYNYNIFGIGYNKKNLLVLILGSNIYKYSRDDVNLNSLVENNYYYNMITLNTHGCLGNNISYDYNDSNNNQYNSLSNNNSNCLDINYSKELFVRNYSDTNNWPNKTLPSQNHDVVILSEWKMKLDISTQILGSLTIKGLLFVDSFSDGLVLRARRIIIEKGGEFRVGTETSNFKNRFSILLSSKVSSTIIKEENNIIIGKNLDEFYNTVNNRKNKLRYPNTEFEKINTFKKITIEDGSYILNMGTLCLFGDNRYLSNDQYNKSLVSYITKSSTRGSNEIYLEKGLSLYENDTILIINSDNSLLSQELHVLISYNPETGLAIFNDNITGNKYGQENLKQIPDLGIFDLRTKAYRTNRNIVIESDVLTNSFIYNVNDLDEFTNFILSNQDLNSKYTSESFEHTQLKMVNCRLENLGVKGRYSAINFKYMNSNVLFDSNIISKSKSSGINIENCQSIKIVNTHIDQVNNVGINVGNMNYDITIDNTTVSGLYVNSPSEDVTIDYSNFTNNYLFNQSNNEYSKILINKNPLATNYLKKIYKELNACYIICVLSPNCYNINVINNTCAGSNMYGFILDGPISNNLSNCKTSFKKEFNSLNMDESFEFGKLYNNQYYNKNLNLIIYNLKFENNISHSTYGGFVVFSSLNNDVQDISNKKRCIQFNNNLAYNNLGYGLSIISEANNLKISNYYSVNNYIGLSATLSTDNNNLALEINDSYILGYNKLYPLSCINYNIFYNKVGIILPTLNNIFSDFQNKVLTNVLLSIPHHNIISSINTSAYSKISNTKFFNFDSYCITHNLNIDNPNILNLNYQKNYYAITNNELNNLYSSISVIEDIQLNYVLEENFIYMYNNLFNYNITDINQNDIYFKTYSNVLKGCYYKGSDIYNMYNSTINNQYNFNNSYYYIEDLDCYIPVNTLLYVKSILPSNKIISEFVSEFESTSVDYKEKSKYFYAFNKLYNRNYNIQIYNIDGTTFNKSLNVELISNSEYIFNTPLYESFDFTNIKPKDFFPINILNNRFANIIFQKKLDNCADIKIWNANVCFNLNMLHTDVIASNFYLYNLISNYYSKNNTKDTNFSILNKIFNNKYNYSPVLLEYKGLNINRKYNIIAYKSTDYLIKNVQYFDIIAQDNFKEIKAYNIGFFSEYLKNKYNIFLNKSTKVADIVESSNSSSTTSLTENNNFLYSLNSHVPLINSIDNNKVLYNLLSNSDFPTTLTISNKFYYSLYKLNNKENIKNNFNFYEIFTRSILTFYSIDATNSYNNLKTMGANNIDHSLVYINEFISIKQNIFDNRFNYYDEEFQYNKVFKNLNSTNSCGRVVQNIQQDYLAVTLSNIDCIVKIYQVNSLIMEIILDINLLDYIYNTEDMNELLIDQILTNIKIIKKSNVYILSNTLGPTKIIITFNELSSKETVQYYNLLNTLSLIIRKDYLNKQNNINNSNNRILIETYFKESIYNLEIKNILNEIELFMKDHAVNLFDVSDKIDEYIQNHYDFKLKDSRLIRYKKIFNIQPNVNPFSINKKIANNELTKEYDLKKYYDNNNVYYEYRDYYLKKILDNNKETTKNSSSNYNNNYNKTVDINIKEDIPFIELYYWILILVSIILFICMLVVIFYYVYCVHKRFTYITPNIKPKKYIYKSIENYQHDKLDEEGIDKITKHSNDVLKEKQFN